MNDQTPTPTDELTDHDLEAAAGGAGIPYAGRKLLEIGARLLGSDADITPEDEGGILDI
ncbi:MAG: hypothetical protein AAGI52_10835 [Bacteroidota bacterium]